jgi:LysR family nitrogen assimilation transcriptional regulator
MEIRDLRSFVVIARLGSFSRAASEVLIAQPALSRQVRRLEEEVGVDLLVRHGKGVTPTPAGRRLLDRAKTILHQLDHAGDRLADPAGRVAETDELVIGLPQDVAGLLAPAVTEAVLGRWPEATLRLREADSGVLEGWLAAGHVSAALLYDPPPIASLHTLPVLTERLVLVAAPHMAVAGRRDPLRFREAAQLPLILPDPQHRIRRSLAQAALQHGVSLNPTLEAGSAALAASMVRRGLGCAVMTPSAVQDDLARGLLACRPIDRPTISTTLSVATPSGQRSTELARLLRGAANGLVTSGRWAGATLVKDDESLPRMAAE